jgi:hypothetical protein
MVASIPQLKFLLIHSQIKFRFVTIIPQYFSFTSFSMNILAIILSFLACLLVTKHEHTKAVRY